MSDETLLSAARRVVRFCNIDQSHGGLYSEETLIALLSLDKMVRAADTAVARIEAREAAQRENNEKVGA